MFRRKYTMLPDFIVHFQGIFGPIDYLFFYNNFCNKSVGNIKVIKPVGEEYSCVF